MAYELQRDRAHPKRVIVEEYAFGRVGPTLRLRFAHAEITDILEAPVEVEAVLASGEGGPLDAVQLAAAPGGRADLAGEMLVTRTGRDLWRVETWDAETRIAVLEAGAEITEAMVGLEVTICQRHLHGTEVVEHAEQGRAWVDEIEINTPEVKTYVDQQLARTHRDAVVMVLEELVAGGEISDPGISDAMIYTALGRLAAKQRTLDTPLSDMGVRIEQDRVAGLAPFIVVHGKAPEPER